MIPDKMSREPSGSGIGRPSRRPGNTSARPACALAVAGRKVVHPPVRAAPRPSCAPSGNSGSRRRSLKNVMRSLTGTRLRTACSQEKHCFCRLRRNTPDMTSPSSPRKAPELLPNRNPHDKEGAGNAGCWPQPMARLHIRKQAAVTTGPAGTSGIPCAMGFRLIRDLPGDRLSCPRHRRIITASLASAPGCQDHTISTSAKDPAPRHDGKPPQPCTRPVDVARPHDAVAATASRPACRDDAYAPPVGTERG